MTLNILDELNIPNEYMLFKNENPAVPFAVWWIENERFKGSDETWTHKESDYIIELYTAIKDVELEEKLEKLIPAIEFEKTETYLMKDNVFCNTYTYTIITKRRFNK